MQFEKQKTSVIITVLNDADGVVALLRRLYSQSRLPDEIVLVDGGSTDGLADRIAGIDTLGVDLRFFTLPGANISKGRNYGIQNARYDIIACTDAGSEPQRQWLEQLVKPFADPKTMVVGGTYQTDPHNRWERVVGLMTMPGQLVPVNSARFNPSARSIAFRRIAWQEAGGFPEWLYTAEDTLFDCKLRKLRMKFVLAHDAVVRWRPRSSVSAVWRQFVQYARGEGRIGRGDDSASFWQRRYVLAACIIVLCAACTAWTGGFAVALAGSLASVVLLAGPFHSKAAAVKRRTGRVLDYPVAIFCGNLLALAGLRGTSMGRRDRKDDPQRFVEPLRKYWGSEKVEDIPNWITDAKPPSTTLIVGWHWPPSSRASTNVLSTLFGEASPDAFRVLTRRLDVSNTNEQTLTPLLSTERVSWPLGDDSHETFWAWPASIVTSLRMVLRARRMHADRPFTRILAVCPHRYGLLVGWIVSRILGVPLVAYMHDLMAETILTNRRSKKAFWQWVDRQALSSASLVVVPTREFADYYGTRGIKDTWVLPHCIPNDVRRSEPPAPTKSLKLAFCGSVYQAQEQAVETLVSAVQIRNDVDLIVCSDHHRVWQGFTPEWLPRSASIKKMHTADVLVVPLAQDSPYPDETQGCFPSKIVDYLAVGRPILAIAPAGSFVDRFIRETGCGLSVTDFNPETLARAIDQLRDVDLRLQMIKAGRATAEELSSQKWMAKLEQRLTSAPAKPETSPIVAPIPVESEEMVLVGEGV